MTNFKFPKAFIFDMDGTLIDSSEAMRKSVNFVRKELGLPPVSKKFLELHINKPDENLPMIFYGTKTFQPLHRELFREHYLKEATKYISLYEGVEELLNFLKERAKLFVATNAHSDFAENMLGFLEIKDYFELIVGSNHVKNTKPSSEMVDFISNRRNLNKKEAVLIGDSTKDMLCADSAGIDFWYAKWGYSKFDCKTLSFDTPIEIKNYLSKSFKGD